MPDVQFVLPLAMTIPRAYVENLIDRYAVDVTIIDAYRYNARAAADFAWVASGTATLETAFLGVPMIILYRTSWLTWMLAKRLVNLPYIGLVNIVAGERIVPELLQDQATAQNLLERTLLILREAPQMENMRYQLNRVRRRLEFPNGETPGAAPLNPYGRAAEEFLNALDAG